jgi:hypothetical protein
MFNFHTKATVAAIPVVLKATTKVLNQAKTPLRITQVFKLLPADARLVSIRIFFKILQQSNFNHVNLITSIQGSKEELKFILKSAKTVLDGLDYVVNCKELHALLPTNVKRLVKYQRLYDVLKRTEKTHKNLTIHKKGNTDPRTYVDVIRLAKKAHTKANGRSLYKYPDGDFTKDSVGLRDKYINIICLEHGPFKQHVYSHLHGQGCPKCHPNRLKTTEEFVSEAMLVHKYADTGKPMYSYDRSKYKSTSAGVKVTCQTHGDFTITPNAHLRGQMCPKCVVSKIEYRIKGKTFWLDSKAEIAVLNDLVLVKKIPVRDILVRLDKGWKPLKYTLKGVERTYYPDFFIPTLNTVIEVKSDATLGLVPYKTTVSPLSLYRKTVAKAKACVEDHKVKFKLMLVGDTIQELPKNWYYEKRADLAKYVRG